MKNTRTNRGWAAVMVAAILMTLAAAISAPAQTFKTLWNFSANGGYDPSYASLVQGTDGNLYGTTEFGGNMCSGSMEGCGTVFKISPAGTLTNLYTFCAQPGCPDGGNPVTGLVLGADGNFYGTTSTGGTSNQSCYYGCGTVFRITPSGTLTTLHAFDFIDGSIPEGVLIQSRNGSLLGTPYAGGSTKICGNGCGTVFMVTMEGILTTLHKFGSNHFDGYYPAAGLVEGTDGDFYGTTHSGGTGSSCIDSCGVVYKVTPAGTVTILHDFNYTDGGYSLAALTQGADGNFYGTTSGGGTPNEGTVFTLTPSGVLTTLHTFGLTYGDGTFPSAAPIQGTNGNFYGTTYAGGDTSDCPELGCGTIFSITSDGSLTILHPFDGGDGSGPNGGLVQHTNGTFYGTTGGGGASTCGSVGCGTVFALSVGLGLFVETVPTTGKAGRSVIILGTALTGTTSVSFNGSAAGFTVESATYISSPSHTAVKLSASCWTASSIWRWTACARGELNHPCYSSLDADESCEAETHQDQGTRS